MEHLSKEISGFIMARDKSNSCTVGFPPMQHFPSFGRIQFLIHSPLLRMVIKQKCTRHELPYIISPSFPMLCSSIKNVFHGIAFWTLVLDLDMWKCLLTKDTFWSTVDTMHCAIIHNTMYMWTMTCRHSNDSHTKLLCRWVLFHVTTVSKVSPSSTKGIFLQEP